MKKTFLIGLLVVGILIGGVLTALEKDEASKQKKTKTVEIVVEPEITMVEEKKDFGMSEAELSEIEHCMRIAGWEYDRSDFERVYRLKDEEMTLNPATFAEYEVTIKDGTTHRLTLNRTLVDG